MGHCLRRVRVFYFLKGARMGYGGSEEKMLRGRAGMGQEALKALKALSARTANCGQGTELAEAKGICHEMLQDRRQSAKAATSNERLAG